MKRSFRTVAIAIHGVWVICNAAARAEDDVNVILRAALPRVASVAVTQMEIGGQSRDAVLDTAASICTLDKAYQPLVKSLDKRKNVVMADGIRRSTEIFQGPSFNLQLLKVQDPEVVLVDLQPLSRLWGRKLGAIVGIEQLRAGVISLNYDTNLFTVRAGSGTLNALESEVVSLVRGESVPAFIAEIEGHRLRLMIDSGSDGAITLPRDAFESMVKTGSIDKAAIAVRGLTGAGMTANNRGWFTRGTLMGRSLVGVSVKEMLGPRGGIGLQWLCAFNIEIDMAQNTLRYQQRQNATAPAATQLMIGAILFYDERGATVERLRPGGGPAQVAGLEVGDVLESIGSVSAEMMNTVTIGEIVAEKAGTTIPFRVLKKRDGTIASGELKLPEKISVWNFPGREYLK